MKLRQIILKVISILVLLPILYVLIALLCSSITIDREIKSETADKTIYLTTNGVHLDVVIHKSDLSKQLLLGLKKRYTDQYFSFGWGDENFYINTPTWGDLTFKNAFSAMFLKSTTLMHVTRYRLKGTDWVEVKVTASELELLNNYLQNTFRLDKNGAKVILEDQGYTSIDDFYKAKGSYSCFKTCNSWLNTGFKQSGMKACLWTPFDFGLMNKYE
ncbi:DUF2459 domain-containing protein [Flammeovirga aprica]|uniref:DUF2459 domain-containing protein n=1 Tax=Flammeovirga aprica JL-4 TaxID=694437 RepID=A0A7X9S112_9BACT|nr:DUF2459 domain-containing protein [Flammeovirga aprica]NME72395.1 DUF2459 domain-containing protein [Flammeovirga aprica JL-4]